MKRETQTVLETPFTSEQIKSRKGNFGKMLEYIEGHSIIHRLNEAFESDWSFEITEHNVYEEEVVAIGKLTVANITKMQFGSNKVTRDSNTGKILSLGDDLKSASTDALKKRVSLLGIGLHLYGGDGGGTIELPQKKVGRSKNPTTSPTTKKIDNPIRKLLRRKLLQFNLQLLPHPNSKLPKLIFQKTTVVMETATTVVVTSPLTKSLPNSSTMFSFWENEAI